MIQQLIQSGDWLPYSFAFLLGLSFLLYAILDGYDLGVGMLSALVNNEQRERMIASIGPFWDANETWLVLGVGLLLVAFPTAHGIVLNQLYLPVAIMIIALIFRGVSFDFRKKVATRHKPFWNRSFCIASIVMAMSQGYMAGRFVTGLQNGLAAELFAVFFGFLVIVGYTLMGASWLVLKTEGELQKRALRWCKKAIWLMVGGAILSSIFATFTDTRIYERMYAFPELALLLAMPLISLALTLLMHALCSALPLPQDKLAWLPFGVAVSIFVLGFAGLAYSFYPYIIPGQLKIVDACASRESLMIILVGTLFVLPCLLGYTALSYRIFRGKAGSLSYD